ncbi:MAG: glycosyltransferase [Lachnospiraceae bacterium]|nr:glycosyltransferase [Lachnospiraceae bacterium]
MNNVLAIVVTYNRLPMLKEVVSALLGQTAPCDILIVDNASTDDTAAWVKDFISAHEASRSKLLYENTGANLGGAGGFNYGMRRGVELGYDYVWIMDDDAIAQADALAELLKGDSRLGGPANYGFLSSIVYWTDGSLCTMNTQRTPSHYLREEEVVPAKEAFANNSGTEGLIPIETATFVSLLIPASTILKVGLPIREFFIWSDDIEYTVRTTIQNKLPAYIVPTSSIIHKTKNNAGSDIVMDDAERIDRYRYAVRNGGYAYKKYGFRHYCAYLFGLTKSWFLIWFKSKDHKLQRSRVLCSSFFKGLTFNPPIEFVDINKIEKK